jgi:hypothetical protein
MKQLIHLLICGLFFVSCYKEIDLSEYATTPKMVINCTVSPDTVVMASITRTWFYAENMPDVRLPHAKVDLYINDHFIEQMQLKTRPNPLAPERPDTLFFSDTIPIEGDKIKIVASTPEYGTATAEDVIPKKVQIKDVQYYIRKGEGLYEGTYPDYDEIYYEVTFTDLPDEDNYYFVRVLEYRDDRVYGLSYWSWVDGVDYYDPIFKEQDNILDGGLNFDGLNKRGGALFTDQSIKGQSYTLQLKESSVGLEEGEVRRIAIYSLSQSYYLYLLSLQKVSGSTLEGGLGNIGFAEPLRVYSNVEGGTGILGGNQHSETEITLNNIPKK